MDIRTVINLFSTALPSDSVSLFTTGNISKIAYQEMDSDNKFYMAGSMGLILSIGIGIAVSNSNKKVFVFDGDGSLIMDLNAMILVKSLPLQNLVHLLLDNSCYESTGGQQTLLNDWTLSEIAESCNYNVIKIRTEDELISLINSDILNRNTKAIFVHIKCNKLGTKKPPQIKLDANEIYNRFKEGLNIKKL